MEGSTNCNVFIVKHKLSSANTLISANDKRSPQKPKRAGSIDAFQSNCNRKYIDSVMRADNLNITRKKIEPFLQQIFFLFIEHATEYAPTFI